LITAKLVAHLHSLCLKVVKDGKLVIIKDGKQYTTDGRLVE